MYILPERAKCKYCSRNTSEGFLSSCLEHELRRCRDLECWDQVDKPRIQKGSTENRARVRALFAQVSQLTSMGLSW